MIINLHRTNTTNVGDLYCAPAIYFPEFKGVPQLDILGYRESESGSLAAKLDWIKSLSSARAIIIGGGGLLGIDFFEPALRYAFENKSPTAKTVLWGAGHNAWQIGDWRKLKASVDLSPFPFDLAGIRDADTPLEWVPCVSCMHEALNNPGAPTQEVGLYIHHDAETLEDYFPKLPTDVPRLTNAAAFSEVIAFIQSIDLLLTDSFHGAYWATLMGKRVVAFPSSSKFYGLKHAVPLCDPLDWQRFANLAIRYPDALEECRDANRRFAQKAFDILGL